MDNWVAPQSDAFRAGQRVVFCPHGGKWGTVKRTMDADDDYVWVSFDDGTEGLCEESDVKAVSDEALVPKTAGWFFAKWLVATPGTPVEWDQMGYIECVHVFEPEVGELAVLVVGVHEHQPLKNFNWFGPVPMPDAARRSGAASPAAGAVITWRDMGSAPRDGTHILVVTADFGVVEAWWDPAVPTFYKSQEGWASYDPENAQGDWVSEWTMDGDRRDRRLYCGATPKLWHPAPELGRCRSCGPVRPEDLREGGFGLEPICRACGGA